ncbi:cation efflux protein [Basidiobolus meristosporus CBS 931.73]|uniref:Cation efflux protein n=1 Tax=Basidiobolus meristosporus CBS 931.73 TaxID=1314790 RepID=A0A1Y1XTN6_9FUNG|nr:cation efflux protein [Basidiobolus meristosporus CBS 931.73]|eukprot:ORX89045.1 cation efflux protein [Basidiobolus meristosporus CBS 931.73]
MTSKSHSGILLPTHDGLFAGESTGVLGDAGSYIQIILENQDSRQIFYFLLLNLSYMFVQMVYGVWTNSLGLISDAIHMFFDCLALGVGLFASVMSKWPANRTFSYGYSRIETLSGFSNGVFLILISIFIVIEAVERLIHPPEMNTHRLLLVSFVGFVVNLIGIFAFNHGHAHGHGHGGCGGGDHGHDHHGHNANMQGVFLHIMADTLGSVGVIISTLLIEQFGWTGFDPIASIFIAVLIFMSVIPLIKNSMNVLMLQTSHDTAHSLEHLLPQASHPLSGVQSYSAVHFWPNDSESTVGTLHLTVTDEADEDRVRAEVTALVRRNISNIKELCVQVEKLNGFNSCECKTSDDHLHAHATPILTLIPTHPLDSIDRIPHPPIMPQATSHHIYSCSCNANLNAVLGIP